MQEFKQWDSEILATELKRLREVGELADYTDQELMTAALQVTWKKPN